MKKAAVINDLSGFGKCSLTAAISVLSALGVQCCPLATAVLTGQTGYTHYSCTDLTDMMPEYIRRWKQNGVQLDAIYSGYMTGAAQLRHAQDFVRQFRRDNTLLLVDPVMGDDGHVYGMYSADLLCGMKELSRSADLITPNLTEACLLADMDPGSFAAYRESESLLAFAGELGQKLLESAAGAQHVVITGIRCADGAAPVVCNLAVTETGTHVRRTHCFPQSFSGTGDLFASVLCGCRLRGMDTVTAMELAGDFLGHSIAATMGADADRNDGVHFEPFLRMLIDRVPNDTVS